MQASNVRITELTIKYIKEELSPAEEIELNEWLDSSPGNRERFNERIREENILEGLAVWEDARAGKAAARARIDLADGDPKQSRLVQLRSRIRGAWVAAAILVIISGAWLLWFNQKGASIPLANKATINNDLPPGGNKATLKLADGAVIVLDNAQNGNLARQGVTEIVKAANGQLVYNMAGKGGAVGYNTVTTPPGGQYQVTLPDNSKVWLNAASSIRFPTAFSGGKREVEITGEAYFEVAKNKMMPFQVKANEMYVTVLGTHFNIMAYHDETSIQTTLLEGSVRINKGSQAALLSPGQQARVNGQVKVVNDVNTEEAVAWKNGSFEFNGADIETVMRTLARWYNVDIKYEGNMTSRRLTAQVDRNKNASEVLQILESAGYHFRIDGKTIIVLP